jgi:hypothetical protein
MKKGIYLCGNTQIIKDSNGGADTVLIKHVIAQLNDPGEGGYAEDPQLRIVYLKPEVMDVLPEGTVVSFEIDTKTSRRDGKTLEKIVPVNIKPVKPVKQPA